MRNAGNEESVQTFGAEAVGEQRPQGELHEPMVLPGHQDLQVRGELIQHLAAGPAGPAVVRAVAHHGQPGEFPAALADGLHQRGALGADRGAEGGVFHVAAGVDHPIRPFQGGPHGKVGVGDVGALEHGEGLLHQFLISHGITPLLLDVDVVVDVIGTVAVVAVALGAVAELHLRVGQVRLAADGALVQGRFGLRLGVVEVHDLGAASSVGTAEIRVFMPGLVGGVLGAALPVGHLPANVRGEEEQIVQDGHDGDEGIEEMPSQEQAEDLIGEERRVEPGQPLDLHGNDEEEQDLQVREEGGKGEEHGHIHIEHGRRAHQEAHGDI